MRTETFTLSNAAQVNRLMDFLKLHWRESVKSKKYLIVTVKDKQEDISSAQRRLYFMWCTQFANKFGMEQPEAHLLMKRKFLINIYRRDDEGFAAMCDAIALLKKNEPEQAQAIGDQVIKLTSITNATKIQMSEFMDHFYRFAQDQGLWLQTPDDLKFAREMAAQFK